MCESAGMLPLRFRLGQIGFSTVHGPVIVVDRLQDRALLVYRHAQLTPSPRETSTRGLTWKMADISGSSWLTALACRGSALLEFVQKADGASMQTKVFCLRDQYRRGPISCTSVRQAICLQLQTADVPCVFLRVSPEAWQGPLLLPSSGDARRAAAVSAADQLFPPPVPPRQPALCLLPTKQPEGSKASRGKA